MIDHTGLNLADLVRGRVFYEEALAPPGFTVRLCLGEEVAGFGAVNDVRASKDPGADFWISRGEPQRPRMSPSGRPAMPRFRHSRRPGLAARATDHGAAGYHTDYHAAFVIDRDGNNAEVVCHKRIAA